MLRIARENGLRIDPRSVSIDDTGWDFVVSHALADDGTPWILRWPRRADQAASIAAESRLLALLTGRLPVAIPDWRLTGPELIAYPRLPGEPAATEDTVTYALHWRIDRADPPRRYVETLGRCMAAIHATPVAEAAATGIPVREPKAVRVLFGERLEIGRTELGMHPAWWERGMRWLDDDALWSERTVLIHGDLHPGHTLVDEAGELLGILDWTDAEIGDPGQEFIEAARKFDPPMLGQLVDAYVAGGGPAWPGLRRHVIEGIAFAPLILGIQGLASGKQRYIDAARKRLGTPERS